MRIGTIELAAPVVLAPMAGVTNAPFRSLCREFGPGLVYVNEMVMATALVYGNAKTDRMVQFGAGESPRSERPSGHQEARNGASHFASSRPVRGARPVRAAPADPFFDRPYERRSSASGCSTACEPMSRPGALPPIRAPPPSPCTPAPPSSTTPVTPTGR